MPENKTVQNFQASEIFNAAHFRNYITGDKFRTILNPDKKRVSENKTVRDF